jgi:hypothetical protein
LESILKSPGVSSFRGAGFLHDSSPTDEELHFVEHIDTQTATCPVLRSASVSGQLQELTQWGALNNTDFTTDPSLMFNATSDISGAY